MEKLINDYRNGELGFINSGLTVLAASSTLFTYDGSSIDAETFGGKAMSSVFAIAGGTAIYMFWNQAIKIAPALKEPRARHWALGLIGAGCLLILGLSSSFNVAGLAGDDALDKHVSVYVGEQEEAVDAQFRHSQLVDGLAVDVRSEVERYDRAAKGECNSGAYSGQGGAGAVCNALTNIHGRLQGVAGETDKFLRERERLGRKSRGRLETIRKLASSDKPREERMRAIAKESDALRMELARMDARRLSESVARTLDMLPREIDIQTNFASDSGLATQQAAALGKLREDIERSSDKLGEFIADAASEEAPRIESFERISAVRAVVTYWDQFIPFWVGGIVLDIAPLAVVIFLMIALRSRSEEQLAIDRVRNRRVGDMVDDEVSKQIIRSASADPKTLKKILDILFGREGGIDAD